MVKIRIDKKYSTNHCFFKSLKYGGNTKIRGFTIDNLNVIKNKHTQFSITKSPMGISLPLALPLKVVPCYLISRGEKNIIIREIKKFVFDPRTVYKHKIYHHFPHSKDVFHLKKLRIISRKSIRLRSRSTTPVRSMPTVRGNDRFHDLRFKYFNGIPNFLLNYIFKR